VNTKKRKRTTRANAPHARSAKDAKPVETVLVLRTCNADMSSHSSRANGFKWPTSGEVSAPNWRPTAECGHGLHGFLWGCGQSKGSLFSWAPDAKWLVVEVRADEIVELGGKVKFPRGRVVYCGERLGATSMIAQRKEGSIIGHTATAGDSGTATAGDSGTATAGVRGTATAGVRGTIVLRWYDAKADRCRNVIGYTGEAGIEAGVKYKLNAAHEFELVP
jgi:hypothetical protein